MDAITAPPLPMGPDATSTNDACPICLEDFHGRDVTAAVVKPIFRTQCGHRYHVDCITQLFLDVAIDRRRCAYCRGDPFPVMNLNTGESHQVKFLPNLRFYLACSNGNREQVSRALAEGVNVNAVMNKDTPLILASNEGDEVIVDHLLKAGAEVNTARTEDGATALMVAAQRGRTNCVKLLLKARANVNARNVTGATPLYFAAEKGRTGCVKLLLNAGADRNIPKTSDGATPLSIAVSRSYVECVELLIKDETDLNTRFRDGNTLLLIAACKGTMELLIKNGADLNAARTSDGATPLFIAALKGNTDCVETLINGGANVNAARTSDGATPLFIAALKGNTNCVETLINAGADLNAARTSDGATPLSIAIEMDNVDCALALIKAKTPKRTNEGYCIIL
ncbi:ankyrin repeat domain-containing protein [Endozoicomonas sp. 2B-B]